MPTYTVQTIVEGQPTFTKPLEEIVAELKMGGALKVLTPAEVHSLNQIRWIKGVAIRGCSDWNGETPTEWDQRFKDECGGSELLKTIEVTGEDGKKYTYLTLKGTSKKNLTQYIENILSRAITMDWPVTPPDPELKK